jgi:hypothetical protein
MKRAASAKPGRKPRAPLPRQTGGAHRDKTKQPWRARKHKAPVSDDERS